MKKWYSVVLVVVLAVVMTVACACEIPQDKPPQDNPNDGGFVNPGDNLGGGGIGDVADVLDKDAEEVVAAGNIDLSSLANNTNTTDAKAVAVTEQTVELTADGKYILSGNYSGGVAVKGKGLTVHLILSGANISAQQGVALSTDKKCKLTITLVENTTNSISNVESGQNALHVKGSLDINGKGTLAVTSSGKNAVKVSGALQVVDSTLTANGANHAIACASFACVNANVSVTANKDGINADCDYDNSDNDTSFGFTYQQGFVSVVDSSLTAQTKGDGIQAETFCYLKGSNVDITTQGEFVSDTTANRNEYDLDSDDFRYIIGNDGNYQKVASDYFGRNNTYALTQSCKGIKVGEIDYEIDDNGTEHTVSGAACNNAYCLVVDSGIVNVSSTDDALHVNGGNLFVNGGTVTVKTLDDGLTADNLLRVNSGKIEVRNGYEGLEGAYVEINGGEIVVNVSDDGINAATDDTSVTEHIIINDGTVTVTASGDGIDSNGSILIAGGVVTVFGPTSGMDAALDADRGIVVTGGTLFACSSLGMVETPAQNSTQKVLSWANSSAISQGTLVEIVDANDNVVVSVTLQKDVQSLIVSSPLFATGETYRIFVNQQQLSQFTISGVITSVGTTGQGGFGPMGPGGGGPGGGNPPSPPGGFGGR